MKKINIWLAALLPAMALCGCTSQSQQHKMQGASAEQMEGTQEPGKTTDSNDTGQTEKTTDANSTGQTEKTTGSNDNGWGDGDKQPEMEGGLTVSCFYEEEFLRTAAEAFMDKYPNVKITINSYEGDSGVDAVPNYQTYLNTKIMTGKAEDILFTSFLPVAKYSEMGVFEDLSSYISATPEINDENYFMNVLQAAKQEDGKLYLVPYKASFNTLGFSEELLSGHTESEKKLEKMQSIRFSEAMDIAKLFVADTEKNNAFLIQSGAVAFMDFLIKDDLKQFIDMEHKTAAFDTPEYMKLLESVQVLSENRYFDSDIDFYNMEYYFAASWDYDVQAAYYSLDENVDTAYCMPIADADGNVSISANAFIALNSASDKKDLAWEFIRYLLSEEVQTLPSMHGPAVNRRGFDAAVKRYYQFYKDRNDGQGNVDETAYKNVLTGWMNQINSCDMLDSAVISLIEEENNRYFTGQQTAEETARNLQRQIEQYLNG